MTDNTTITLDVDLTNPGQFLACCGVLELANCLDRGSMGFFDGSVFQVTGAAPDLLEQFVQCKVTTAPSRKANAGGGTEGEEEDGKEEKSPPVILSDPFNLRLDWWEGPVARAAKLITWSGGANIPSFFISTTKGTGKRAEIVHSMRDHAGRQLKHGHQLLQMMEAVQSPAPFNFDGRLSRNVGIDLGYVPKTGVFAFSPVVEVLALVGLQRFRPKAEVPWNRNVYHVWADPLPAAVASAVVCGRIPVLASQSFAFPIVRRDAAGKRKVFGSATLERSFSDV